MTARILVLGASGRLGGMLRRHWPGRPGLAPLWHGRGGTGDVTCDLLDLKAVPPIGPVDVVLGLAGIVPGQGDLAQNVPLGCAAVRMAGRLGARRAFVVSSAAVYGDSNLPWSEQAACPPGPYGMAKRAMEVAATSLGTDLGMPVTALRIANVAGADALLARPGPARVLDRFVDGSGPVRSYIGPSALAAILAGLCTLAATGQHMPDCLNLALDGPVAMADLCAAAGLSVTWAPAPDSALGRVVLDVARLQALMPVPQADPAQIVADWQADQRLAQNPEPPR